MIRAIDVTRLVDLYGEPLRLGSRGYSTYDPIEGEVVISEDVIDFIGYRASYDIAEIDGTNVIRGDRKVIIAPQEGLIEPQVGDTIDTDSEDDLTSIISVGKIMSGTTVVCYICQVRK